MPRTSRGRPGRRRTSGPTRSSSPSSWPGFGSNRCGRSSSAPSRDEGSTTPRSSRSASRAAHGARSSSPRRRPGTIGWWASGCWEPRARCIGARRRRRASGSGGRASPSARWWRGRACTPRAAASVAAPRGAPDGLAGAWVNLYREYAIAVEGLAGRIEPGWLGPDLPGRRERGRPRGRVRRSGGGLVRGRRVRPDRRRSLSVRLSARANGAVHRSRSSSLRPTRARVFASTRLTMTAQARLWVPSGAGRLPGTTTEPAGTRPWWISPVSRS